MGKLLAALLPRPLPTPQTVLALLAYWQRHNQGAYRSHRGRRLAQVGLSGEISL